ncbi:MAG: tyrosine-type recombinase/integrase [Methylobacter sp.]
MAITDAWLKANSGKGREAVEEKTDRDGLSARVSKKGKVVFQLRFRHGGKQLRMDVGTYPLISLKQSREEALRFKAELEKGHDPRIIKKTDKAKNVEVQTLESVFNKWYDAYCIGNKKNHQQIKRSFELYVFPKLGGIPPDRISTDNWVTLLEEVKKKTPAIATRLLVNTKQMLSWAVRRKLVPSNELAAISAKNDLSLAQKPGKRSLSDEEIGMLLLALEHSRMSAKNRLFVKLCLIYGCRNGELRIAKKKDFDFKAMTWTVPAENHKVGKSTGKPLIRPITDDIKVLLDECFLLSGRGEALFNNADSNEPMGRSVPLSLPYNIMQWLRKNKSYEMPHWSIHDLRKTARTNFSTLTQPHIAEMMLGHKMPGEWGVYDQHHYLQEQADCLNQWTARLRHIVAIFPLDQGVN